jgi:hypothetical protein
VTSSSEENQPSPAQQTTSADAESKHWLEYAIFIFVIVTAAATGYAAYYTKQQWLTAVDTEQRSLRAYVGAGSVSVGNNPPQVGIAVENYGQTPAIEVKIFDSWHDMPKGKNLPPDFTFPDKGECDESPSMTVIYPKAAPVFSVAASAQCASALAAIARGVSGQTTLYLYGHIDYLDVFREKHMTTYCLSWASGTSAYCDRHNEIDPKN